VSARQHNARLSPALRSLVDQAGPATGAATRALLLLGAAAAGLNTAEAEADAYALLGVPDLAPGVRAALRRLVGGASGSASADASGSAITTASTPPPAPPEARSTPFPRAETAHGTLEKLLDDPLLGVGMDV
jgi:hypothetical protein